MTLLDSNVAICASERGSAHHDWARRMIVEAVSTEGAVINAVCLAEICVGEDDPATVADRIRCWGVEVIDVPATADDLNAQGKAARESMNRPETDSRAGRRAQRRGDGRTAARPRQLQRQARSHRAEAPEGRTC